MNQQEALFLSCVIIDKGRCSDYNCFNFSTSKCSMSNCFNLSVCLSKSAFKVYVYPNNNESAISVVYSNILKVLRDSNYYTSDPNEACLFVLSIDTIDRDRRSENYVKHVDEQIQALPQHIWNDGRNHIVFNLYHGTYPDYSDHDLGFNVGYAIVARASANTQIFRPGFDLSFPLFHKEHSLRTTSEPVWSLKLQDEYLVSFKGKRYVYGIGSETRDALYHLHNGRSVVMVTTCKHNTDWKKYEDERCDEDNIEYERWDYESTMSNSTFCLTPRGRRLGSFRFLEALRLGCIPVILSDDWELPFSEIIDWSQATVIAHEDTVLTITDILQSIPIVQIIYMKQQARALYQRYFSSVEKIVLTTVQIIEERIAKQQWGVQGRDWNSVFREEETRSEISPCTLPTNQAALSSSKNCEVVILATNKVSGRLVRLVRTLSTLSEIVTKITVLWPTARGIAPLQNDFSVENDLDVVLVTNSDQSAFFNLSRTGEHNFVGDFVLLLDERVSLKRSDFLSMFGIALQEPNRLVGFYSAMHVVSTKALAVNLGETNEYSIILLHCAILNRRYLYDFWRWVPQPAIEIASRIPQCYVLLLNFMLTEKSAQSPVSIGNRVKESWMLSRNYSICLNKVSSLVLSSSVWPSTGLPLISSRVRVDPIIYPESSQNNRKQFPDVEL
ncbi:unnamed protein product [Anisakis simplex]|uniref:Multiple exostoses homolog 1 (inferred by orthology to a C. elegans protein) n=1 Tax=Anisakis simplex TaxID=6269 RepID=A0A0M3K086_ANISI|nr:unnamed protein product [Anisakis simplex]